MISIHALREEGDPRRRPKGSSQPYFYPRPPRGGRRKGPAPACSCSYFYPRPPRGGRPGRSASIRCQRHFYPRPPRGGRLLSLANSARPPVFLSTPSARRATKYMTHAELSRYISIHALREEGDGTNSQKGLLAILFLSTPSARRATAKTETKSLFSNKLYNILHEFRRALIYNGSKNYPNHAK